MKELSDATTKSILELGSEGLRLEFKPSYDFSEDIWLRERTIRAVLAMSNTRAGGDVIIGVKEDKDKKPDFAGVEKKHLDIFESKNDDIKSIVESFASSPTSFDIYKGLLEDKDYIIIRVREFNKSPIICRKSGEHESKVLQQGDIYIRTLKDKPSSVKLIDPLDIQDLLERSVDKEISSLHKRGWVHTTENKKKRGDIFTEERNNFKL